MGEHASYKVAKKVLEWEYKEEIPRSRLRTAYGDGFKGAPLRCHSSGEGAFSRDEGTRDGEASQTFSTNPQTTHIIGGPCHV